MRLPAMIILLATAIPAFAAAATSAPAPAAARPERKVATIQAEMRSENWNWYGEGAHIAASMPSQQQSPEKFERVDTEQGQAPTFSGKVMGIPPGKRAHVTVVANVGNQWTSANNYKSAPVAADGTFTVAADHNPAAVKSLAVNLDGSGISHFLPAEFQARQSARDIEFQLPETKSTVLSMEDPQGKEVRNFRVEIFNAFPMRDAQTNRVLRIQRLFAASSAGGVIVFDAPADEPIALLVSAPGTAIAPYYEIITPRDAAEFHFKMIPAARLRGVVTRDGQPLASESMLIINPAAPCRRRCAPPMPRGASISNPASRANKTSASPASRPQSTCNLAKRPRLTSTSASRGRHAGRPGCPLAQRANEISPSLRSTG